MILRTHGYGALTSPCCRGNRAVGLGVFSPRVAEDLRRAGRWEVVVAPAATAGSRREPFLAHAVPRTAWSPSRLEREPMPPRGRADGGLASSHSRGRVLSRVPRRIGA